MKDLTDKIVLILIAMAFMLNGCVEIKMVDENESDSKIGSITIDEVENSIPKYGAYAEDIDELLAVAPIGSKVTLNETEDGEIYLRIEKIFTAQTIQENTSTEETIFEEDLSRMEIDNSLYSETITI